MATTITERRRTFLPDLKNGGCPITDEENFIFWVISTLQVIFWFEKQENVLIRVLICGPKRPVWVAGFVPALVFFLMINGSITYADCGDYNAAPAYALSAVKIPAIATPLNNEIQVGACDNVTIQPTLMVPIVDVGKTATLIMYVYIPDAGFGINVPSKTEILTSETKFDLLSHAIDFSKYPNLNLYIYYGYIVGTTTKYNVYSIVVGDECNNSFPDIPEDIIGFKGLHLSMTNEQVNELVADTPWGYSDAYPYEQEDFPQYGRTAFLDGDRSQEGSLWARLGCEKPNGTGICYWIDSVFIRYYNNKLDYNNKLVDIVLSSPKWSANYIEPYVKNWGKFALNGLIKKYGDPNIIYETFNQVDISSFKSGFYANLYQWDLNGGKERIILSIAENNAGFCCTIRYQDVVGVNALEQENLKDLTVNFER